MKLSMFNSLFVVADLCNYIGHGSCLAPSGEAINTTVNRDLILHVLEDTKNSPDRARETDSGLRVAKMSKTKNF